MTPIDSCVSRLLMAAFDSAIHLSAQMSIARTCSPDSSVHPIREARVRLTRSSLRRAALTAAAVGLVVGSVLVPNFASASPLVSSGMSVDSLTALLNGSTAGAYYDASGKLVVTVTDASAAKTVAAAGATAKHVTRTGAQLDRIQSNLDSSARVVGTAWSVDPATNQVVVSVDSSVTGAKLATVEAAVKAQGAGARLEHVDGVFTTRIAGGDADLRRQYRCSLGLQRARQRQHVLLPDRRALRQHRHDLVQQLQPHHRARHAGTAAASRATTTRSSGTRTPPSPSTPAASTCTRRTQDITGAANADVGEAVQRSGSTTASTAARSPASTRRSTTPRAPCRADPHERLRRGRRQRRPAVRRQHRARPHLRRQRQLQLRRYDVLPARGRSAQRLRLARLLGFLPPVPRRYASRRGPPGGSPTSRARAEATTSPK